jgi:mRNA interferase RelE/StbE
MPYRIELTHRAEKDLDRLPTDVKIRIIHKIETLSENPRPHGVEKLSGEEGFYRIRVGDYRVIYEIQDDVILVLVLRLGHRSDIYRKS